MPLELLWIGQAILTQAISGLTMLLYVIDRSFAQDSDGAYNYPGIEVIQRLLSMGADVTQKVSPESSCKPIKLWLVDYDDLWNSLGEYEVAIPFAGHSAISYIVELQRVLAENPHQDFEFEETFLQDFWAAIYRSLPAEEVRHKKNIDRSLRARWYRILNDTSTHNVTFETADDPVTAHDWMLREASIVLKAMLESSMQLGSYSFKCSPHC